jgi:hypothetical protein
METAQTKGNDYENHMQTKPHRRCARWRPGIHEHALDRSRPTGRSHRQLDRDRRLRLFSQPRAVIRQEQTDLKEPGITYNAIKYNPVGSADFVNPNLDVAYLEAWIAVDDKTPVLMGALEVLSKETEIRYHISAAEKDMKVLEE